MSSPAELAPGLWRWTLRHPEFHPDGFGEVAAYAWVDSAGTLLVDPIVGDDPGLLDDLVRGDVAIVISIPYHVRDAERLAARYGASLHGHENCARRLADPALLTPLRPGPALDGRVEAFPIGRPRRSEQPLWLTAPRAVVFGDAIVETGGALRVWAQEPLTDKRLRSYEERLKPTLEPLAALGAERVLPTHGEPVLEGGAAALSAALAAPPWYHRG